jgi:uncharacterized cupredoxin-like copper-binding protein
MIACNGIAAIALAGTAALPFFAPIAEAAEPITVKVVMNEYRFAPDHLEFRQGVRYRLRLENSGGELHEFTAAAFFKSAQIENAEQLNADHTDVVLQPHESKEVILTPRRKGSFTLVCADHDWEGMVGKITVK